jgi:exodeoxyribonuclease-3
MNPLLRFLASFPVCAAACLAIASFAGIAGSPPQTETFRLMTFNLWVGGDAGRQPLTRSAEVIRAARADIAGLQETLGAETQGRRPDNGRVIASQLGWNYHAQGHGRAVASRFPIVKATPRGHGVIIQLPSGREIAVFNVHLAHAPYQPYQLLGIPYANAPFVQTAREAVQAARDARGDQIREVLNEIREMKTEGRAVFLTGDFNEPSHQDWTPRAARAGVCPMPVRYPTTRAVTRAGLRDAFRSVHPDEVGRPGWTWTPTTSPDDPKDRHDRIDLIFYAGRGIRVGTAEIIGESPMNAEIVVQPYPSDHRAVVAEFLIRQ